MDLDSVSEISTWARATIQGLQMLAVLEGKPSHVLIIQLYRSLYRPENVVIFGCLFQARATKLHPASATWAALAAAISCHLKSGRNDPEYKYRMYHAACPLLLVEPGC